jgi:hypothetical protein
MMEKKTMRFTRHVYKKVDASVSEMDIFAVPSFLNS